MNPGVIDVDADGGTPLPRIRRAFAELSIGQVHYATAGDRQAPAVLLLHQSPRSWMEYRAVLPLLGRRCHAISMDTAGFGDSAPVAPPASIEKWAAVAAELLATLQTGPACVVGHHTGGVVAVELAAAHAASVRALVLSSTPYTDEAFRLLASAAGSVKVAVLLWAGAPDADAARAALARSGEALRPALAEFSETTGFHKRA